jgi:cell division protein FtsB
VLTIMIKKLLKDKRVIFAVLGIVLVLPLVNFNQRMTLLTRLRRQEKELTEYYSHLESTRTALEAELIYAQSDQAVERWAREDAMMIQPGDIPIVLLPSCQHVYEGSTYSNCELSRVVVCRCYRLRHVYSVEIMSPLNDSLFTQIRLLEPSQLCDDYSD